jgi:hypothetical protein
MAVVREVQTIGQSKIQYQAQFGRHAATLTELGPPANGAAAGPQAANLIPASLAPGEKNDLFALRAPPDGYAGNANPKVFGGRSRRSR